MINFLLPRKPKIVQEEDKFGIFEIEGLYPGYGLTLGNALRRVLLSSLPGAAIVAVQIKGVSHEFSAIDGVMEDVVQIILNLKKVRVKMFGDDVQNLILSVKGEKEVLAGDIEEKNEVKIMNPEIHLATLTNKKAELEMVITIGKGLGYISANAQKKEKLPIGTISLDSIFSPVEKVDYEVENMRVGERTDFNRLRLTIETDGSITPRRALKESIDILKEHLNVIGDLDIEDEVIIKDVVEKEIDEKKEKKVKTKKDKSSKK